MMETANSGHDSSSPSADNKRNLKINVSQSGESIKLKITNHDGAAKVVSNHHSSSSSTHNHHAPKNKDSTDHAKKDPNKKPSHENGTIVTKHKDKSHSSSHKSSSKSGSGNVVKVSSKHKDNSSNHVSSKSETSSSSKPNESVSAAKDHKHLSNNVSKTGKTTSDDFKSKPDKTVTVAKHKDGSSKSTKEKDGASSKTSHGVKPKEDGVSSSSKKHKEGKDGTSNGEKAKNADGKVAVKSEKPDLDSSTAKTNETKDGVAKVKSEGDKTKDKRVESKHKNKENHDKKEKHKHNDVKVEVNEKHKQIKDSKSSTHAHDKVKDKSSSGNTSKVKPSKDSDLKSEGGQVKLKLKPLNDSTSEDQHTPVKVKPEQTSDDDVPLSARKESKSVEKSGNKKAVKRILEDSDDEEPLVVRAKKKAKSEPVETKKRKSSERDESPVAKKKKVTKTTTPTSTTSPKKKKKEEETQEVWKWWEEEKRDDKVKWKTLQHKGPILAPDYEPLPKSVQFKYNGKVVELTQDTEELATFYAKLLDHDYTSKEAFNTNFFKDWRKVMTPEEKELIKDLKKCDFRQMNKYFLEKTEAKKAMTKEEKAVIKKQNEDLIKEYGFCIIDGHKEKIGNFKIEPPGLFRGRGEHPKMGRHKRRIMPRDVIINCSRNSEVPKPPNGHRWKEVRHDNTVTWLACWTENIQGQTKYVMLNPSSKLKGEKDWQKYEVARKLKSCVDKIRANYRNDWKHKEMKVRQRAVALYFIDQLALRAGNEKEEGETADTVGCCSLRVEHITLHDHKDGKQYVVNFDFLGKDSIRYENSVPVEKRVYKNLQIFMENKQPGDDLFDRLNTAVLNKHLNELMDGLTAKVFRTFNASKTLQEQLNLLTKADDSPAAKLLSYNRANRAVAILCNHQRAVPKTFNKSMENLQAKLKAKEEAIEECEDELRSAKKDYKNGRNNKDKSLVDRKSKQLERLKDQLSKLEIQATDREENKQIALGTSKLNYLDPRITVAWCKKWDVPIEKVYNRTQRDKFRWAIEMAGPDFVF